MDFLTASSLAVAAFCASKAFWYAALSSGAMAMTLASCAERQTATANGSNTQSIFIVFPSFLNRQVPYSRPEQDPAQKQEGSTGHKQTEHHATNKQTEVV
jgi:hypothetical protein